MRYLSEETVAYTLRQIERDMIDMAIEEQFTVADIKNIFDGWLSQLRISPSQAVPVDEQPFKPDEIVHA